MRTPLLAVLVLTGCGNEPGIGGSGGDGTRVGVAKAAETVAPNSISCSSPAPQVFQSALCICKDLDLVGSGITVECSEGHATNVGVNGTTHVVGHHSVAGSLSSFQGIEDTGTLEVRDQAITTGDLSGVGNLKVGQDLSVGGDLSTVGNVTVGGKVRVKGQISSVGNASLDPGTYQAPAGPPCGCDSAQFLDVAAEVAKAAADNDDAKIALDAVQNVGTLKLSLEGGRYYLKGLQSVGRLSISVHQPSALYVDGDFETVGDDEISVDEGASLDLYVNGRLENVGNWTVGKTTLAGVVRLYIGGKDASQQSVGNQDFVGSIYAPSAAIELVGNTRIRGALFAGSLEGTGSLLLDYAAPAVPAAGSCPVK